LAVRRGFSVSASRRSSSPSRVEGAGRAPPLSSRTRESPNRLSIPVKGPLPPGEKPETIEPFGFQTGLSLGPAEGRQASDNRRRTREASMPKEGGTMRAFMAASSLSSRAGGTRRPGREEGTDPFSSANPNGPKPSFRRIQTIENRLAVHSHSRGQDATAALPFSIAKDNRKGRLPPRPFPTPPRGPLKAVTRPVRYPKPPSTGRGPYGGEGRVRKRRVQYPNRFILTEIHFFQFQAPRDHIAGDTRKWRCPCRLPHAGRECGPVFPSIFTVGSRFGQEACAIWQFGREMSSARP